MRPSDHAHGQRARRSVFSPGAAMPRHWKFQGSKSEFSLQVPRAVCWTATSLTQRQWPNRVGFGLSESASAWCVIDSCSLQVCTGAGGVRCTNFLQEEQPPLHVVGDLRDLLGQPMLRLACEACEPWHPQFQRTHDITSEPGSVPGVLGSMLHDPGTALCVCCFWELVWSSRLPGCARRFHLNFASFQLPHSRGRRMRRTGSPWHERLTTLHSESKCQRNLAEWSVHARSK